MAWSTVGSTWHRGPDKPGRSSKKKGGSREYGQAGWGNLKVKRSKPKAPKGKLVNQRAGSKRFGQVYREEAAKGGSFHIYGSGKNQERVFVPGGGLMGKTGGPIGGARRTTREEMEKASRVGPRQQVGTVNDPTEVAGKREAPKKGVRPAPRSQMIERLVEAMRGQNAGRTLPRMPPQAGVRRPIDAGPGGRGRAVPNVGMYGRGAAATTRKRKKS